ncbi:hypothetical protein ACR42D_10715 [Desulfovibrio caledoniensis]
MKPVRPDDDYRLQQMRDPRLYEPPTAKDFLGASLDAAGKGAKAGVGAIEQIIKFIFWAVIFLAALKLLLFA